ncbi:hypothetical protein SAMD00023353_0103180 [Rosellinia necatrix]|uniref:BZIP domain-containing protein n=1 Tax=Rosellinia necatrix TaxID=77044 RepID=A0A1S8A514_ROSNE|nr:hypothetical protein SAMD00023353_0103180 [Rosellinia necatrix]
MNNSQEPGPISTGASVVSSSRQESKKRVITTARKEQNKLAQRAYRKRQREKKKALTQPTVLRPRRLEPRQDATQTLHEWTTSLDPKLDVNFENTYLVPDSSNNLATGGGGSIVTDPGVISPLETGAKVASNDSSPSSSPCDVVTAVPPEPVATAPSDELSLNHHRLLNIALSLRGSLEDNSTTIFRACLTNAICIGLDLTELMCCELPCISPFYRPMAQMDGDPGALVAASSHDSLPASLRPTPAQILIPHHASLDLVPLPRLRERAILMCAALPHVFSLWEMKLDIYTRNALECRGRDTPSGVVSRPWDMRSWQAAPWFMSKWKMVVDADEVATNLSIPGIPGLWM